MTKLFEKHKNPGYNKNMAVAGRYGKTLKRMGIDVPFRLVVHGTMVYFAEFYGKSE